MSPCDRDAFDVESTIPAGVSLPEYRRLRIKRQPMTPAMAAAAFLAVALDAVGRYHHSKGIPTIPNRSKSHG
jgi:hypothetical protein